MKALKTRYVTPKAKAMDYAISIGITAAMTVMATRFGWGKTRLRRLQEATMEFVCAELTPTAPKCTEAYLDELEYKLTRMTDALNERMK